MLFHLSYMSVSSQWYDVVKLAGFLWLPHCLLATGVCPAVEWWMASLVLDQNVECFGAVWISVSLHVHGQSPMSRSGLVHKESLIKKFSGTSMYDNPPDSVGLRIRLRRLGHLHAAELLLNFSYSPLHAMGEIELNPILSYFAVYFPLE
jgi:hypothetical protein